MYIDTLIKEGAFINDLSALIEEHGGFVVKNRVTKVSYPVGAGESKQLDESIIFSIAQHTLLRHEITQMIYGLAQYNEIEVLYGMMPPEIRTALTATDVTARADLAEWVKEQSDYYQLRHTLYTYMCESYTLPDDDADNPPRLFMAAHEEPKRFALDMEVFDTTLEGLPQLVYPQHFQSPITPFHLRIPDKEALTFGQPLYAPHTQTNWWADSKIRVRGVIAETHLFLMLLADTAPAFQHNVVPLVPLFWGLFIPESKDDDGNLALFAGSAQRAEDPFYDFDALDPFLDTKALQPLLKDYIEFPANGIDDIMVYRTKNGAKYQVHRLIAEVESNIIPPPREHEGMKYPRAWQDNMHSQAYQYQMNPSRYSKRVETSRPIIYHAEEGKRGIIPDCLVCNPLSIRNGAIFKDRVQTCPDVNDLYRFFIIEGISPFTKLPTTPFRPLGVALRMTEEKELDWKENLEQWQENPIDSNVVLTPNPSPLPIIQNPTTPGGETEGEGNTGGNTGGTGSEGGSEAGATSLTCGGKYSNNGQANRVYRYPAKISPGSYFALKVSTFAIPDAVYVSVGNNLNDRVTIYSAWMQINDAEKILHLPFNESHHGQYFYVQFNTKNNPNTDSVYDFELICAEAPDSDWLTMPLHYDEPVWLSPMPEGWENGSSGNLTVEEEFAPNGTQLAKTINSVTVQGEPHISREALEQMNENNYYVILCNGTKDAGCQFNLYFNNKRIANAVDIEANNAHKIIEIPLDLMGTENKLTVQPLSNKQISWEVFVMTYEQAVQYVNNDHTIATDVPALTSSTITFNDTTSAPPVLASGMSTQSISF